MKLFIKLVTVSIIVLLFHSCGEPEIPQGWALVYGIENYPSGNSLLYTVDDAEDLAALLKDRGWEVTLRTDAEADMTTLLNDINTLESQMGENDRFMFYFSGHGAQLNLNGGEGGSATDEYDEIIVLYNSLSALFNYVDGLASAEEVLAVTVSDDSLAGLLGNLPTKNKTVIIDACNSGGFIGDGFTVSSIESDYVIDSASATFAPIEAMKIYAGWAATDNDLLQSEYTILTAAGETEESYELSSLGHGIFTYFLLLTPQYADYNYDGYITLTEAWKYIAGSLDSYWNSSNYVTEDQQYMANIAAFPVDPVLFTAD